MTVTGHDQPSLRKHAVPRSTLERLVLERQLALFSKPMAVTVYGLPLWALIVCWMFSGAYPDMGIASAANIAAWYGVICLSCATAFMLDRAYRRAKANPETFDVYLWMPRFTAALTFMSIAWASIIWLFWEPSNVNNQMALVTFVIFGVMNGMVARMNRFETYLAGSSVSFLIIWLRCITTDSDAAGIFSIAMPMLFVVLTSSVRTASRQIYDHLVAQIENEWLKEENARARDEAEHANRMKSNFLANMSHELRTPLNAVLGFSEIIALQSFGPDASDKYRDYAADIHSSGKHLLSMINGLLDVAKIEAGKLELQPEWFDGGRELHEASRLIAERAAEKGVALEVVVEPGAEQVWCDERAFLQIAINLLSNAVKFTGRGFIRAGLKREAGTVVLYVKDTGCGIPAAQLARVFEAFEQVDNRYTKANTGTGLGLTLVRALVTLHGGQCRIESVEGTGTTISVTFPLPEAERMTPAVPAKSRVA
jgi:two-component system cell cycle sensor histidine kinase PleC